MLLPLELLEPLLGAVVAPLLGEVVVAPLLGEVVALPLVLPLAPELDLLK